jgi:hypothetical protein
MNNLDLLSMGDLKPVSELAKQLPVPPSSATLWRWHAIGIRGVKLDTVRIGGRRYTSHEAFNDFVRATNERCDSRGAGTD